MDHRNVRYIEFAEKDLFFDGDAESFILIPFRVFN